jgi:hypothetical protein
MCDGIGCLEEGQWRPVIVFVNDRGFQNKFIMNKRMCLACRRKYKDPKLLVSDGGEKVKATLEQAGPAILRIYVDWAHKNSQAAKEFDQPS